jgi:hypothetical protein
MTWRSLGLGFELQTSHVVFWIKCFGDLQICWLHLAKKLCPFLTSCFVTVSLQLYIDIKGAITPCVFHFIHMYKQCAFSSHGIKLG